MPPKFPKVQRVELQQSPLVLVVCQIRFPAIVDLDERHPPGKFQRLLKFRYPVADIRQNLSLEVPQPEIVRASREVFWSFEDPQREWTVSIGQRFLSLETKRYRTFNEFIKRFRAVLDAARKVHPIEIRERIGLRYVDRIARSDQDNKLPEDWPSRVNQNFIPLRSMRGSGEPQLANIETRFCFDGHVLAVRSAFVDKGFPGAPNDQLILDFDCYSEEKGELSGINQLLEEFRSTCYNAFRHAVGDLIQCFGPVAKKRKPR